MHVTSLCPLPFGVVAWASPQPWLTAIVKATFSIDRDGVPQLAAEQRLLDDDRPSDHAADELAGASDFAPQKERVDVLLVGHARAAEPSAAIAASFELGDLRRTFVAVATGAPTLTDTVPLSVAHLRADASPAAPGLRVGPLSPRSPVRRALAGDQPLGFDGLPVGPLAEDFDFSFFNAAPPEQQLDALAPGATLVLTGLVDRGRPRRVILPRMRPLVYLADGRAGKDAIKLGMRCDTLIVDTDRAEMTLVWRGAFAASADLEQAGLLLAFEPTGTRWSGSEIRERFRSAPPAAVEIAAVSRAAPEDRPAAPSSTTPHDLPTLAVLVNEVPEDELSTMVMGHPTVTLEVQVPAAWPPPAPTLPFRHAQPLAEDFTMVVAMPAVARDAALPFRPPSAPDPIEAAPSSSAAPQSSRFPGGLLDVAAYGALKRALAETPAGAAATLAQHGFDASSWEFEEQMQRDALEAEARRGQRWRAVALAEALGNAPDKQRR
jgi:hypothetical protein